MRNMNTRKIYYPLYAVLCFLCLFFVSCEKPGTDTPRDEALVLKVSSDSVSCVPRMGEQTALQIQWTAGTNHGTGSAISYTLEMDRAGNDFAAGIHWEIGRTMDRTIQLGHKQLSDTLKRYFPNMEDEVFYEFDLRVRAKVLMTDEEQISPVVTIRMTRYTTILTNLYLVGDATPNGWTRERATPMIQNAVNPSLFSWKGLLRKGEFKILTSTADWLPCYVRDENDASIMHYRKTEDDYPDFKWEITTTDNYTIDVDIKALTISINSIGGEIYKHVYMIGDATSGGWSWDNITELEHPEPNIFTYEGFLNRGEIKFPTELKSDWSGEMLYAPSADCNPAENGTYDAHKGEPDNKWTIHTAGDWSITINIKNTTISFIKL